MKPDKEKNIDNFCKYFSRQVASISAGNFSDSPNVYKRLLLCCIFDALAKLAFPNMAVGERFNRLIQDYGDWPNSQKVSLLHLKRLLSLPVVLETRAFDDVRKFTNEWPLQLSQNEIFLDTDPAFLKVDEVWPKHKNGDPMTVKFGGKNLSAKNIRHDRLFYAFRNNLVHEFNAEETQGYPIHAQPYYLRGRIYYTTEFITALVVKVINNLRQRLKNLNINPHDSFSYGDFVIPEMNNLG